MKGFSKKLIGILIVASVLMGLILSTTSFASTDIEHNPELLKYLLSEIFDVSERPESEIGSPFVTVSINNAKFNNFLQGKFVGALNNETNTNFYDELFKNKQLKSDQEMLSFANKAFRASSTGSKIGGAVLGGVSTTLSQTLGGIAVAMVTIKIGQDWWNNGISSKAIADNAHDLGLALAFVGSATIGGPLPLLASAGIILHKFTPVAQNLILYDGYDSTVEKLFNRFSKTNTTYQIESGKFTFKFDPNAKKPVKKEFAGPLDSALLPANTRPEDYYKGYDQSIPPSATEYLRPFPLTFEDFVGYEQTWKEGEFFLDWNDIAGWDRILKHLFTKYMNEPEKVTVAVEKFLDDYTTLFWRLPPKLRLYYMQDSFYPFNGEQYKPPTKAEQELYSQKLKAKTMELLAPLFRKYYEYAMSLLHAEFFTKMVELEKELNQELIFKIEIFDQKLADKKVANPYVPLYTRDGYKYPRIIFKSILDSTYSFDSQHPNIHWRWNSDNPAKCTYLSYLLYGSPPIIDIHKFGEERPSMKAAFILQIPNTTIRISKDELGDVSGRYFVKSLTIAKDEKPIFLLIKDDGEETLSIITEEKGKRREGGFMKFNRITGEVTKNETWESEILGKKQTITVNLHIVLISTGGEITGSGTFNGKSIFVKKVPD